MPSGTTTFGAFFGALACALLVGGASAGGEGAAAAGTPGAPKTSIDFKIIGIGGAGGMYTPAVSPDGKTMLASCDMSGCYRSTDVGKSWEMIHWRQISSARGCRPCFDGRLIYWAAGASLRVSTDQGKTWAPVVEGEAPWAKEAITRIAAPVSLKQSEVAVPRILVGTNTGLWCSLDIGKTWTECRKGKVNAVLAFTGMGAGSGLVCAAVDSSFIVSSDLGRTWEEIAVPETEGKGFLDLAGGAADGKTALYGLVFKVGTLKSVDGGKTWKKVDEFRDLKEMVMASNQTEVVYAAQVGGRGTPESGSRQIYRTRDGGATWTKCFVMDGAGANVQKSWVQTELHWGYSISDFGLGVSPADAKTAMVTTQGDFYVTRDGGDSWQQIMNEMVGVKEGDAGFRYRCNGLEVTSCWEYLFDPFERNRRYIAYTDIGFARSVDSDETWISATRGSPWGNTYYKVICDPDVKGRLYAAASNRHDIPHWTHTDANKGQHAVGGVIISDDFGASWKVLGTGLPKLPCTSLAMDLKSPPEKRILYCTLYEGGVYKSTDGGSTWVKKSEGLGNPGNLHCYMIKVHPKTGDVFCSITAHRDGSTFPVAGGVWKSTDGGETWADISKPANLHWPASFAVDPANADVVYLTAATIPGGREGGLYKTSDGGKTWERLMKDEDFAATGGSGFVHCLFVNLHPDHPEYVYIGTAGHGLWVSTEAGKNFKRFEGIPFTPCQNVAFDPQDKTVMYVTTFGGGVWKGNYLPEKK